MKKSLLALSLLGGVVFAQDKPLDPCGSPKEVFSKHLLDQCYKGYFDALMEAKRNAEEALKLAIEANNKLSNLEKRISSLEKTLDDKALMEAKRNAEEALRLASEANNKIGELENRVSSLEDETSRLATEANNKLSDLEKRVSSIDKLAKETSNKVSVLEKSVSSFEKIADDHERRIRVLESRKPEAYQQKTEDVGPYRSQLEEVKKNADEALRLATEANNKLSNLEKRISSLEKTLDDKALMEAKRNAEEALRLASEANNKIGELENRVSSLEDETSRLATEANNKIDDLENRVSSLEDEIFRLATEANNKLSDLEKRVSSFEKIADDHERRIRALESRKPEAYQQKTEDVGPYRWQLEEVGTVHFDFNKFNIKKSEAKKLDEIVNKIKESGREVLVVGFADKRGTSSYNFNLSMWRAQMTASYLARKGVNIGKIRIAAYGKEVADLLGKDFKSQRVVKIFLIY